jgi:hypothetical protein
MRKLNSTENNLSQHDLPKAHAVLLEIAIMPFEAFEMLFGLKNDIDKLQFKPQVNTVFEAWTAAVSLGS